MMQAIAGIHYNFSMPDAFWQQGWEQAGKPGTLQNYQNDGYLGLIRNFSERVWLLIYLLGASPAVCASFLAGRKDHPLVPFDETGTSLHLPYATSLRMGDLGYNSSAQSSLQVCYNQLDTYIQTLHQAIVTPHPAYSHFKVTDDGEMAQLNDSLLQIENEFYSPIRPKRVTRSGEAPLVALQRAGIEYIEVRCLDINPFLPLGIDAETIRLVDTFLLDALLSESPQCGPEDMARNKENIRRVVESGRDPQLKLLTRKGERSLKEVAGALLDQMAQTASLLDDAHRQQGRNSEEAYSAALGMARTRIADPELTPSGRILREMRDDNMAFWQLALKYSRQWQQGFREERLCDAAIAEFETASQLSLHRLATLEADNSESFETYLARFFDQYHGVKL
jgi:glutamate--cysteine ligase